MELFGLFNVVWYDGTNAYVSKFILQTNEGKITDESKIGLNDCIIGNGEVLKIEFLHYISYFSLKEMEESNDNEIKAIVDRFASMYFVV